MRRRTGAVVAVVVGAALAAGGCREAGRERPEARPGPGTAGALSAAELQGRWWTWAASEPYGTNPVADPDGRFCGRGQPADVWFLAGTFGGRAERTCTVPPATPIAFPLVNSTGEPEDCAEFMRTARGSAALDGTAVDSDRYPGTSVTFEAAPGNTVTSYGGSHSVTACGLWVQLPAVEPGRHTLTISGSSGDFAVAVDYVLLVSGDRTV